MVLKPSQEARAAREGSGPPALPPSGLSAQGRQVGVCKEPFFHLWTQLANST